VDEKKGTQKERPKEEKERCLAKKRKSVLRKKMARYREKEEPVKRGRNGAGFQSRFFKKRGNANGDRKKKKEKGNSWKRDCNEDPEESLKKRESA